MTKNGKVFLYKGVRIHYIEEGQGDPLLLLHGFGASSFSWRHIVKAFSDKYQVIALDLKGFGLSDKPIDNGYSINDQSQIVADFIREKNLQDVTLVGHSFGGGVALFTCLEMLQRDSNSIAKMVLIGNVCYRQDFSYLVDILRIPLLNRLSLAIIPSRVIARKVLQDGYFKVSKITDEAIQTYGSYLELEGAYQALIRTCEQIIPEDVDTKVSQYKNIDIPVLIVWGDNDTAIPLSLGMKLANDLPNARFKVIPNCGHIPQEECPDETIGLINDFFADSGTSECV